MSKKNVIYIALAMSLGLIGLVSVQYYWTSQALKLSESGFNSSANEALNEIVIRLEKQEISSQLLKNKKRKLALASIESINARIVELQESYPEISFETPTFSSSIENENITLDSIPQIGSQEINEYFKETNSQKNVQLKKLYKKLKNQRNQVLNNLRIIEELFSDLEDHSPPPKFSDRINPYLLDTIISVELEKKKILTPVEWGVYSSQRSILILQKTGKYKDNLLKSRFFTLLYPSDKSEKPYYLVFYFPDKEAYIISQIWYMLVASLLLLGLQIFIFYYTLRRVLKQKKLSDLKNDFINHITHEIKTPVSTISLVCESFSDPDFLKQQPNKDDLIEIIKKESDRLQSLCQQIVEISKLEKGQYPLVKESFNVNQAIELAAKNLNFQIMKKNGKVHFHFSTENPILFADKTHFIQIISNLIDNANKYSSNTPKIDIYTKNIKDGIQITIADNGIGIQKQFHKKIFEKLYRVPSGNIYEVRGFGLGLNYVKCIVDRHHGSIEVQSNNKNGSKFILFFHQNLQ